MINLEALFGQASSKDAVPIEFKVFPKSGDSRWMLESHFRQPWHLKTWPRANLRARTINRAIWFLASIGIQMPSRRLNMGVAKNSIYMKLREKNYKLGIFLGTPGPNRKFVVYAERFGEAFFVKVPVGPTSYALVQNETVTLDELTKDHDLAELVPAHRMFEGHLAVESVETIGTRFASLGLEELIRVHILMESRSGYFESLGSIRNNLRSPPNFLPVPHDTETSARIDAGRRAANEFWDSLPQDLTVPCYKAHGDFTRWNVLKARDGTARIIDWELFGPKPLYFDLIHYFVSHDILVKRLSPSQILERLEAIGADTAPPELWKLHVGHYFAFQAIYYASIYECQSELHVQALQQMNAWTETLVELTSRLKDIAP